MNEATYTLADLRAAQLAQQITDDMKRWQMPLDEALALYREQRALVKPLESTLGATGSGAIPRRRCRSMSGTSLDSLVSYREYPGELISKCAGHPQEEALAEDRPESELIVCWFNES